MIEERSRETSPRTAPFIAVECAFTVADTTYHVTAGVASLDPWEPELVAGLWLGTDDHEDVIEVRMGHDSGSLDDPGVEGWVATSFDAIRSRISEVVSVAASLLPRLSPNTPLGRGGIFIAVPPPGDTRSRVEIMIEP